MAKNASRYNLFQSEKRGNDNVERNLEDLIKEMQTAANLRKLATALELDPWKNKSAAPPRKLDFSIFEEKLNRAKRECPTQKVDKEDGEKN